MSKIKNIEKIPIEVRDIVEVGLGSALKKGTLGKMNIDFVQIENSLSGGKTGAVVLVARYGSTTLTNQGQEATTFIRVLKIASKDICESENEGYVKTRETLLDIFSQIEYYTEDEFEYNSLKYGILLYQDVGAIATSDLKGVARFVTGKVLESGELSPEKIDKFAMDLSLLLQKEVFLSLKKGLYGSIKRKDINLFRIYGDKLNSNKVKNGFADLQKIDPSIPDLVKVLEYFDTNTIYHEVNYVHGDLNVENVLVWENERGFLSCKLIDFGEVMPKKRDGFTPLFWDLSRLLGEMILNFVEEIILLSLAEEKDHADISLQKIIEQILNEFWESIHFYLKGNDMSLVANSKLSLRMQFISKIYLSTLFDFMNEAKSGLKDLRRPEVIKDYFYCQILFLLFYTKFSKEDIYKRLFAAKLALKLFDYAKSDEMQLQAIIQYLEKFYFDFSSVKVYNKKSQIGPATGAVSPFMGLSHFQEKNKEFFFGREKFTQELLNAIESKPIIALAGASGSGKSSVVYAGVIPELRKQNYIIFKFRPGENPYFSAVHALSEPVGEETEWREPAGIRDIVSDILKKYPDNKLFLLGDQFEELFTICKNKTQREELGSELIDIAKEFKDRFRFFITIRSDFWTKLLEDSGFSSVIGDSGEHTNLGERFFLSPMTIEELRSTIEKPLAISKLQIQDGLSDLILTSIAKEPGGLPLLQFCLEELWKKQVDYTLNYNAYKELGEVKGALATYAEHVFKDLTKLEQEQVRKIFLQLVNPGQGMEDTRRIALVDDILAINSDSNDTDQMKDFIHFLADKRLIVTGTNEVEKQTLEIVHEALIREWARLKEWIDADREFRVWQEKVRYAVAEWESEGRDDGLLLHGNNCFVAEEWMSERKKDLAQREIEFIEKSKELREKILKKEKRISRMITFGSSAAALLGLALSWFSYTQKKDAEINETKAEALFIASNFKVKKDYMNGYFQILKSAINSQNLGKKYSIAKITVLSTIYSYVYNTGEIASLLGHYSFVNSAKFSPDGNTIVSASDDNTIRIWDVATGKKTKTLSGHISFVWSVNFSPDGKYIVSGSGDKTIKLWDVATGKELKTLSGHSSTVSSVDFSPDGKYIASASYDRKIKLWDAATGKELKTFSGHNSSVNTVVFSPDGKYLASGSYDHTVKLWHVATGQEIRTLHSHNSYIWSVNFSSDGKYLVSASEDNTLQVWNASTGGELNTLYGHNAYVLSASFSPDSKTIASGSGDKSIKLWDAATGKELKTFYGHNSSVNTVSFSPDGKYLVSGSPDKSIKLWEVPMGDLGPIEKEVRTFYGHTEPVWEVSSSPDGKYIASSSSDKTIKLWEISSGKDVKTFSGHNSFVMSISFSPNGMFLASGSADNTVKLWDVAKGKEVRTFYGHSSSIWSISFSPDGNYIASGSGDKTIKLWDVVTGKELKTFSGHTKSVDGVSFSPNGKYLASASYDKTIKLWDVDTGKELKTFFGHSSFVSVVAFSPDGKYIASGSYDNTIKLWDVKSGKEERNFSGHSSFVNNLSFSPDGKFIASASEDKTIKLWDVETGKEVKTLSGHLKSVDSVIFSPDGQLVISASPDNTVKLWDMEIQALLPTACDDMAMQMDHWSSIKNPPFPLEEIEFVKKECSKIKKEKPFVKYEENENYAYKTAKEELAVFFFNLGKEKEAFALTEQKEFLYLQRARTGTGEKQIADFKEALLINPEFLLAKDELSQIYFNAGKYEEALALQKNKEYLYLYRARKFLKDAQSELETDEKRKVSIENAKKDYEEALKINPKFQPAISDLSAIYLEEGHESHKKGNYEEAILDYQKSLSIDPENVKAMYRWGIANHRLGKTKEAIVQFKKALKIYANDASAFVSLGFAQLDLGEEHDAIENFEQAIEINPQNGPAFLGWAMALSGLGKQDEATTKYIRARVNAPEDEEFLDWAARRLLKKEKANEYEINEALEYSKRSNDLEADNPKYLDTLAEAYLLSGDKDKAKEINDKAKILAQKLKSSELLKTILDRENKISAK